MSNIRFILLTGISISLLVVFVYTWLLASYPLVYARTIAFTLLIVSHVGIIFLVRKTAHPFSNRYLLLSLGAILLAQLCIITIPFFASLFQLTTIWGW